MSELLNQSNVRKTTDDRTDLIRSGSEFDTVVKGIPFLNTDINIKVPQIIPSAASLVGEDRDFLMFSTELTLLHSQCWTKP
jgi:phospholipid N-methyltransferase